MQSEVAELGTMNAPNTDQLNADDLIAGPRIFTLVKITKGKGSGSGKGDQPINVHLAEHPYPWRPCKTVRRLLMDAWGPRPGDWPDGAQVELYRDTEVRFGGDTVGGIRVRAMSHLKSAKIEHLSTATRGQRVKWEIRRLEAKPAQDTARPPLAARIAGCVAAYAKMGVDLDALTAKLGTKPAEWTEEQFDRMRALYGRIAKDADLKAKEFPAPLADDVDWDQEPDPAQDGELTDRERLIVLLEEYADGQPLAAFLGNRFGVGKPLDKLSEDDLRGYVKQLGGGAK